MEQLETISYYSLINAYSPLFKQENGQYEGNVTFNDFYMCYKYDTRLKNIIFKYIILIEQTLKPIYLPLLLKIMVFKNPLLKERLQTKRKQITGYDIRNSYLDAKTMIETTVIDLVIYATYLNIEII